MTETPEFKAKWDAHKAIDHLIAEAKIQAENRPFTPESAALFRADVQAAYAQAPKDYGICGCSGKDNPGDPLCRCGMKRVLRINGRYQHVLWWGSGPLDIEDLGPVQGFDDA